MKKTIFIIAVVAIVVAVAGFVIYDVMGGKDEPNVEPTTTTEVEFVAAEALSSEINIERTITLDKEYMAMLVSNINNNLEEGELEVKGYKWYETCILMEDWLDANVAPGVYGVSNIFQVARKQADGGSRVKVYLRAHTMEENQMQVKDGFWVEDYDLNEVTDPMITFEQAYDILQRANVRKPHSRHVVLRKAIGPKAKDSYNPQYIFGNKECHYYVDAITGELYTVDPSGIPESGENPYLTNFADEE